MNMRIGLAVAALGAMLARAETNDVIQIWSGTAPGAEKWLDHKFTDESLVRPTVTVFLPPKEKANGSAVLICPGGGYINCMYTYEGYDIARWFTERGIAGFVLRYRRPVADQGHLRLYDHTAPASDVSRAMRLIRARTNEWGVNPHKIGVMGFSAGGHLAATLTVHGHAGEPAAADAIERQSSRPDFAVLIYAVINMNDLTLTHGGSRKNLLGDPADPKLADYYSCELQVTTNTPPAFLLASTDDAAVKVENSIRMYQALIKASVPAELHLFEKGGHGFLRHKNIPATDYWLSLLDAWLHERGFLAK